MVVKERSSEELIILEWCMWMGNRLDKCSVLLPHILFDRDTFSRKGRMLASGIREEACNDITKKFTLARNQGSYLSVYALRHNPGFPFLL